MKSRRDKTQKRNILILNRITVNLLILGDTIMWTKPAATEMRFGFEVTMYVMNK